MVKARILHFSPQSSQHDISLEQAFASDGRDTATALVESRTSRLAWGTKSFASCGPRSHSSGGCLGVGSTYSANARFGTAPHRARRGRRIASRVRPYGRLKPSLKRSMRGRAQQPSMWSSDERPASTLEVPRHGDGLGRLGQREQGVLVKTGRARLVRRLPAPEIAGQRACLAGQLTGPSGVVDRGPNFPSMSHNAGVRQQTLHICVSKLRDSFEVEAVKGLAEVVSLAQDRQPREPGLKTLETDLLEKGEIVVSRHSPLVIVVGSVVPVPSAPEAASVAVKAQG